MAIKTLKVLILSPRETIFQGDALAVSSKNSTGKFDVLPEHANFITLISNEPIVISLYKKPPVSFKFPVAILYNSADTVKIYTDITL